MGVVNRRGEQIDNRSLLLARCFVEWGRAPAIPNVNRVSVSEQVLHSLDLSLTGGEVQGGAAIVVSRGHWDTARQ